jgi:L-ascorbate metabolism protein UlaG (beta-lactamase superfamily)
VIQVDPWGLIGLDDAKPADLILVTDSPGHHLDAEAIASLSKANTQVLIAANGKEQVPNGIVIANGEMLRIANISVQAVAAYDIILGAPSHPKGDANGYVVSLGGKKLFFAGVTECVDEVRHLQDIDVAFMPMNIPLGRMTPAAAAECTKLLEPDVVYTYHYDQNWARRIADPSFTGGELPGGITVAESLEMFAQEFEGTNIEFRNAEWYPEPD